MAWWDRYPASQQFACPLAGDPETKCAEHFASRFTGNDRITKVTHHHCSHPVRHLLIPRRNGIVQGHQCGCGQFSDIGAVAAKLSPKVLRTPVADL